MRLYYFLRSLHPLSPSNDMLRVRPKKREACASWQTMPQPMHHVAPNKHVNNLTCYVLCNYVLSCSVGLKIVVFFCMAQHRPAAGALHERNQLELSTPFQPRSPLATGVYVLFVFQNIAQAACDTSADWPSIKHNDQYGHKTFENKSCSVYVDSGKLYLSRYRLANSTSTPATCAKNDIAAH